MSNLEHVDFEMIDAVLKFNKDKNKAKISVPIERISVTPRDSH